MTKDDIIKMAKEAGLFVHKEVQPEIERFFLLATEWEREQCAKLCHDASVPFPGELQSDAQWSPLCLASAIRARGETK